MLFQSEACNAIYWGFGLDKTDFDFLEGVRSVGVVKRSDAPLVEKLLSERDAPSYQVALPETSWYRRWLPDLSGVPLVVTLFSLLETARITR
jgi:hypothetical protein